ncbi:hypothetical protein BDV93DRAFT_554481 [Ceratobasidium sp. AG-I]|nr:hypothetical protein BDV93DRAFT_554481 [Ceratobasidium sp. AG-I]
MSAVETHDAVNHTAQVVHWASQAGYNWQFEYLKIGPTHNTKWLAGFFVEGVLLSYRYLGHGSKKKQAKDDCCRKILNSNLCYNPTPEFGPSTTPDLVIPNLSCL